MSRAVRIVLLKDLRLLWPLAALVAGLILMQSLHDWGSSRIGFYLPIAAILASALFAIALVHQDPPASLRHDWLTRPVPRLAPLVAKALVFAGAVLLPAGIGAAVEALREGASVAEAAQALIIGPRMFLAVGIAAFLVGSLSASVVQAFGLVVALFLAMALISETTWRIAGLSEFGIQPGSTWIVAVGSWGLVMAGAGAAIWLQWTRRSTASARAALCVTLGLVAIVLALLDRNRVFAVQQMASPSDPAAAPFTLVAAPRCLDARWHDQSAPGESGPGGPAPSGLGEDLWTGRQLARLGPTPLALWTVARPAEVPDGWLMVVTNAEGHLLDSGGRRVGALEPEFMQFPWHVADDGRVEARHAWLMSRDQYRTVGRTAASLEIDYLVALLAPVRSAQIPADGRRHRVPGIGLCTATTPAGGAIELSCFDVGRQPDLLTARPTGTGIEREISGAAASYAPGPLRLSPGRTYRMALQADPSARTPLVTVTVYEARAHVQRRVEIPGVFGGPACRPARGS
jgi:hypothetical protein